MSQELEKFIEDSFESLKQEFAAKFEAARLRLSLSTTTP